MKDFILTVEEYNLLNKITRQTKTDCWFCLAVDDKGFDCVEDLEKGYKVTLRFAIKQLNGAIIPDLLEITSEEKEIYEQLMQKLQLSNPFKRRSNYEKATETSLHWMCLL